MTIMSDMESSDTGSVDPDTNSSEEVSLEQVETIIKEHIQPEPVVVAITVQEEPEVSSKPLDPLPEKGRRRSEPLPKPRRRRNSPRFSQKTK